MSISLTQSNSASSSTTSQACALSSAVAAGDLIIVLINWGSFGQTYTVSDDHGNTYTQFPSVQIGNSNFNDLNAFWAINTSAQTSLTVTVALSGGVAHTLRVAAFDYNSTTGWLASPVDQSNSANNNTAGTSGNPGNITPTVSGTLGISAIQFKGAVTAITVTSPFIEQPTSAGTAGTGWRSDGRADGGDNQNMSTSAQTCAYSWTSSFGYSSLIANFQPAAAASVPGLLMPTAGPSMRI